ncbi:hypothetical protein L3X38_011604 [Prunus dulcis]|uniref:Uncharacterized protein n=1 Tax=Prunus dulcis TaxID=3755 RepID=A0AAD4WHN1_PRUDU|nr:hypothetical protein L3X38_011604 [Prunus dulcis]
MFTGVRFRCACYEFVIVEREENIVTLVVKECQLPDEGNGADDVFGSSTRAPKDYNHTDENDYIGKYGAPANRAHLSHTWRNYINHVGQKFIGGVHEFRDKLCKYAIEKGFKAMFLKNEKECPPFWLQQLSNH